jgi:hypothetical protein
MRIDAVFFSKGSSSPSLGEVTYRRSARRPSVDLAERLT